MHRAWPNDGTAPGFIPQGEKTGGEPPPRSFPPPPKPPTTPAAPFPAFLIFFFFFFAAAFFTGVGEKGGRRGLSISINNVAFEERTESCGRVCSCEPFPFRSASASSNSTNVARARGRLHSFRAFASPRCVACASSFGERGTLEPRTHQCGRKTLLTEERKQRLHRLLSEQPDATLAELGARMDRPFRTSTIDLWLRRLGWKFKKNSGRRRTKPAGRRRKKGALA